jgi:hypothetical protein
MSAIPPPPHDHAGSTGSDDLDRGSAGDVVELPSMRGADAPASGVPWWSRPASGAGPSDPFETWQARLRAAGSVLVGRLRVWFRAVAAGWGKTEREAIDRIGETVGGTIALGILAWGGWKAFGWAGPTVSSWWDSGLRAAGVGDAAHNPVKAYLADHAGGLPWGGATLLHAWVVTGVVVWALAVLRIRAAQVGWVGYVVATAAMA